MWRAATRYCGAALNTGIVTRFGTEPSNRLSTGYMQEIAAKRWNLPAPATPKAWVCNIVWGGNQLALESFRMPGLEGYLLSVPWAAGETGGDIYHVTVCDHGVFSKFLLLDVAGHGDSAATISTRLQQPLARLMSELDNSAILEALNHNILTRESNGSFATALSATYNHWDRSWSYASAGHPFMLIRRNAQWKPLPECSAGPPVGIVNGVRYFQNEILLDGDDWLFLFSDALFEIRQNNGSLLGFDGLVELLNGIDATTIDDFYQALTDALVAANNGDRFSDDLTLIVLKQTPARRNLSGRLVSASRKLMMRWMKRKLNRCKPAGTDLPATAKV